MEALIKGRKEYLPPTFMTVNIAAHQLLKSIGEMANAGDISLLNENSICVALARVGDKTQQLRKCTLKEMVDIDMGPPLHSIIIAGKLHPIEIEMLKLFE